MVVVDKLADSCTPSQAMVLVLTWALCFGSRNGEMFRSQIKMMW